MKKLQSTELSAPSCENNISDLCKTFREKFNQSSFSILRKKMQLYPDFSNNYNTGSRADLLLTHDQKKINKTRLNEKKFYWVNKTNLIERNGILLSGIKTIGIKPESKLESESKKVLSNKNENQSFQKSDTFLDSAVPYEVRTIRANSLTRKSPFFLATSPCYFPFSPFSSSLSGTLPGGSSKGRRGEEKKWSKFLKKLSTSPSPKGGKGGKRLSFTFIPGKSNALTTKKKQDRKKLNFLKDGLVFVSHILKKTPGTQTVLFQPLSKNANSAKGLIEEQKSFSSLLRILKKSRDFSFAILESNKKEKTFLEKTTLEKKFNFLESLSLTSKQKEPLKDFQDEPVTESNLVIPILRKKKKPFLKLIKTVDEQPHLFLKEKETFFTQLKQSGKMPISLLKNHMTNLLRRLFRTPYVILEKKKTTSLSKEKKFFNTKMSGSSEIYTKKGNLLLFLNASKNITNREDNDFFLAKESHDKTFFRMPYRKPFFSYWLLPFVGLMALIPDSKLKDIHANFKFDCLLVNEPNEEFNNNGNLAPKVLKLPLSVLIPKKTLLSVPNMQEVLTPVGPTLIPLLERKESKEPMNSSETHNGLLANCPSIPERDEEKGDLAFAFAFPLLATCEAKPKGEDCFPLLCKGTARQVKKKNLLVSFPNLFLTKLKKGQESVLFYGNQPLKKLESAPKKTRFLKNLDNSVFPKKIAPLVDLNLSLSYGCDPVGKTKSFSKIASPEKIFSYEKQKLSSTAFFPTLSHSKAEILLENGIKNQISFSYLKNKKKKTSCPSPFPPFPPLGEGEGCLAFATQLSLKGIKEEGKASSKKGALPGKARSFCLNQFLLKKLNASIQKPKLHISFLTSESDSLNSVFKQKKNRLSLSLLKKKAVFLVKKPKHSLYLRSLLNQLSIFRNFISLSTEIPNSLVAVPQLATLSLEGIKEGKENRPFSSNKESSGTDLTKASALSEEPPILLPFLGKVTIIPEQREQANKKNQSKKISSLNKLCDQLFVSSCLNKKSKTFLDFNTKNETVIIPLLATCEATLFPLSLKGMKKRGRVALLRNPKEKRKQGNSLASIKQTLVSNPVFGEESFIAEALSENPKGQKKLIEGCYISWLQNEFSFISSEEEDNVFFPNKFNKKKEIKAGSNSKKTEKAREESGALSIEALSLIKENVCSPPTCYLLLATPLPQEESLKGMKQRGKRGNPGGTPGRVPERDEEKGEKGREAARFAFLKKDHSTPYYAKEELSKGLINKGFFSLQRKNLLKARPYNKDKFFYQEEQNRIKKRTGFFLFFRRKESSEEQEKILKMRQPILISGFKNNLLGKRFFSDHGLLSPEPLVKERKILKSSLQLVFNSFSYPFLKFNNSLNTPTNFSTRTQIRSKKQEELPFFLNKTFTSLNEPQKNTLLKKKGIALPILSSSLSETATPCGASSCLLLLRTARGKQRKGALSILLPKIVKVNKSVAYNNRKLYFDKGELNITSIKKVTDSFIHSTRKGRILPAIDFTNLKLFSKANLSAEPLEKLVVPSKKKVLSSLFLLGNANQNSSLTRVRTPDLLPLALQGDSNNRFFSNNTSSFYKKNNINKENGVRMDKLFRSFLSQPPSFSISSVKEKQVGQGHFLSKGSPNFLSCFRFFSPFPPLGEVARGSSWSKASKRSVKNTKKLKNLNIKLSSLASPLLLSPCKARGSKEKGEGFAFASCLTPKGLGAKARQLNHSLSCCPLALQGEATKKEGVIHETDSLKNRKAGVQYKIYKKAPNLLFNNRFNFSKVVKNKMTNLFGKTTQESKQDSNSHYIKDSIKNLKKKRRALKQRRETGRLLKRKRFHPRPAWVRITMYKKFLKFRHKKILFSGLETKLEKKKAYYVLGKIPNKSLLPFTPLQKKGSRTFNHTSRFNLGTFSPFLLSLLATPERGEEEQGKGGMASAPRKAVAPLSLFQEEPPTSFIPFRDSVPRENKRKQEGGQQAKEILLSRTTAKQIFSFKRIIPTYSTNEINHLSIRSPIFSSIANSHKGKKPDSTNSRNGFFLRSKSFIKDSKRTAFNYRENDNESNLISLLSLEGKNSFLGKNTPKRDYFFPCYATTTEKAYFNISQTVFAELQEGLWKSSWLRTNLNSYLRKIKNSFFLIKKTALLKNFGESKYFNLTLNKETNENLTVKWNTVLRIAEYNQITYNRIQQIISNLKHSASDSSLINTCGEQQLLTYVPLQSKGVLLRKQQEGVVSTKGLGKQSDSFSVGSVTKERKKRPFNNARHKFKKPISKDLTIFSFVNTVIQTPRVLKDNIHKNLTENPFFTIQVFGNMSKKRVYWALNKTHMWHFKNSNKKEYLWANQKQREQTRSSKTKKIIKKILTIINIPLQEQPLLPLLSSSLSGIAFPTCSEGKARLAQQLPQEESLEGMKKRGKKGGKSSFKATKGDEGTSYFLPNPFGVRSESKKEEGHSSILRNKEPLSSFSLVEKDNLETTTLAPFFLATYETKKSPNARGIVEIERSNEKKWQKSLNTFLKKQKEKEKKMGDLGFFESKGFFTFKGRLLPTVLLNNSNLEGLYKKAFMSPKNSLLKEHKLFLRNLKNTLRVSNNRKINRVLNNISYRHLSNLEKKSEGNAFAKSKSYVKHNFLTVPLLGANNSHFLNLTQRKQKTHFFRKELNHTYGARKQFLAMLAPCSLLRKTNPSVAVPLLCKGKQVSSCLTSGGTPYLLPLAKQGDSKVKEAKARGTSHLLQKKTNNQKDYGQSIFFRKENSSLFPLRGSNSQPLILRSNQGGIRKNGMKKRGKESVPVLLNFGFPNKIFLFCTIIFHLCSLFSLVSISQIRDVIKFLVLFGLKLSAFAKVGGLVPSIKKNFQSKKKVSILLSPYDLRKSFLALPQPGKDDKPHFVRNSVKINKNIKIKRAALLYFKSMSSSPYEGKKLAFASFIPSRDSVATVGESSLLQNPNNFRTKNSFASKVVNFNKIGAFFLLGKKNKKPLLLASRWKQPLFCFASSFEASHSSYHKKEEGKLFRQNNVRKSLLEKLTYLKFALIPKLVFFMNRLGMESEKVALNKSNEKLKVHFFFRFLVALLSPCFARGSKERKQGFVKSGTKRQSQINSINLRATKTKSFILNTFLTYGFKKVGSIFHNGVSKVTDIRNTGIQSIAIFLGKPGESSTVWINNIFLIEVASDLITTIPENSDSAIWNIFTKLAKSSSLRITPVFGTLLEKRLFSSFELFIERFSQPDTDLIVRQQKGKIFWDIWGEILKNVAEENNINIALLANKKEDQSFLLSKLLESDQQQPTFGLLSVPFFSKEDASLIDTKKDVLSLEGNQFFPLSFVKREKFQHLFSFLPPSYLLPLAKQGDSNKGGRDSKTGEVLNNLNRKERVPHINTTLDSFNTNWRRWSANQYMTFKGKDSDLLIQAPPAPKSFHSLYPSGSVAKEGYNSNTKKSGMGKNYNFNASSLIKGIAPLGTIICQIYSGLFSKETAKNFLVVGAALNQTISSSSSSSALKAGSKHSNYDEKSLLIQSLAGETEMKIIRDNANRYNFALGIRSLRTVFEALALHTPCIFLIEDIHVIGERRPLLVGDDENAAGSAASGEHSSGSDSQDEKNLSMAKLTRHSVMHYRKPFRGDFSFLIPANNYSFDLFLGVLLPLAKQGDSKEQPTYEIMGAGRAKQTGSASYGRVAPLSPLPLESSFSDSVKKPKENFNIRASNLQSNHKLSRRIFSLKTQSIVKELPWIGLSEQSTSHISMKGLPSSSGKPGMSLQNSLPKIKYSIRVKIALLASLAVSNLSVKLNMITDLLIIIDNVRSNRGFVVFATTHTPSILDPALRRPGRLDETIALPFIPKLESRWEIVKSNVASLNSGSSSFSSSKNPAPSFFYTGILGTTFVATKITPSASCPFPSCYLLLATCEAKNPGGTPGRVPRRDEEKGEKGRPCFRRNPLLALQPLKGVKKSKERKQGKRSESKKGEGRGSFLAPLLKAKSDSGFPIGLTVDLLDYGLFNLSFSKSVGIGRAFLQKQTFKIQKKNISLIKKKVLIPEKKEFLPPTYLLINKGVKDKGLLSLASQEGGSSPSDFSGLLLSPIVDSEDQRQQAQVLKRALKGPSNVVSFKLLNKKGKINRNSPSNLALRTAYSKIGQFLINNKFVSCSDANLSLFSTLQTKLETQQMSPNTENSSSSIEEGLLLRKIPASPYLHLYTKQDNIKQYLIGLFAPKVSETLAFSSKKKRQLGYNTFSPYNKVSSPSYEEPIIENKTDLSIPNKKSTFFKDPVTTEQYLNPNFGLWSLQGIDKTWRAASSLIFTLIEKRLIYKKTVIIPKLLQFFNAAVQKSSLQDAPSPPVSFILLPAKRYENYKRSFLAMQFGVSTSFSNSSYAVLKGSTQPLAVPLQSKGKQGKQLGEQLENKQRVLLSFPLSLKEIKKKGIGRKGKSAALSKKRKQAFNLIPLNRKKDILRSKDGEEFFDKPTVFNGYYRSRILDRHRGYLNNQWWNGQLYEHNVETTFLSDIDWRSNFVSALSSKKEKQNILITKRPSFEGSRFFFKPESKELHTIKGLASQVGKGFFRFSCFPLLSKGTARKNTFPLLSLLPPIPKRDEEKGESKNIGITNSFVGIRRAELITTSLEEGNQEKTPDSTKTPIVISQVSGLSAKSQEKEDFFIDFPDFDQHYNPGNRRWVLQFGYWSYWYNFKTTHNSEIYSYMVTEAFLTTFNFLNSNREILDYFVTKIIKSGLIKEISIVDGLKRF